MQIRYPITSKFNAMESFRSNKHLGVDFKMPEGTELRTIKDGIVSKVVNDPNGLGNAVYVDWGDGKTAIYGHMKEVAVKVGDKVNTGDLLGLSGNTGNVVGVNGGYHLHFAIKDNGQFIDPEPYAPLIQEMNHGLLLAKNNTIELVSNSGAYDVFDNAIGRFSDLLMELKMQFITQLYAIPKVLLKLDLILSQIYAHFSLFG